MKRLVALAAVSALFLVGCGGGSQDDADPFASGPGTTGMDHAGSDHAGNAPPPARRRGRR